MNCKLATVNNKEMYEDHSRKGFFKKITRIIFQFDMEFRYQRSYCWMVWIYEQMLFWTGSLCSGGGLLSHLQFITAL